MAVAILWFCTAGYKFTIDTSAPKKVWKRWLRVQSTPPTLIHLISKKDTSKSGDVASVTSSLPSYQTEELPTYNTQTVTMLPPIDEEREFPSLYNGEYTMQELVREDMVREERLYRRNVPGYETERVFLEYLLPFTVIIIEYERTYAITI